MFFHKIAYSAGVFWRPRALDHSFASYGRHLGWENAQRAGESQKRPQGRGRVAESSVRTANNFCTAG